MSLVVAGVAYTLDLHLLLALMVTIAILMVSCCCCPSRKRMARLARGVWRMLQGEYDEPPRPRGRRHVGVQGPVTYRGGRYVHKMQGFVEGDTIDVDYD